MTSNPRSGGFNLFAYLRCLLDGHNFQTSRTFANTRTCMNCRLRKKG